MNDITYDKNTKRREKNPQRTIQTGISKSHGNKSVNLIQDYTFPVFRVEISYIWNIRRGHKFLCFDIYLDIKPNYVPWNKEYVSDKEP